jgi:hypothetical protein
MFAASLGFWKQPPVSVSGGNAVISGDYIVRTFTTSDNLTISGGTLTGVDYLLIGGGGGGWNTGSYRGGGGAGGLLQGTGLNLDSATYPVTVGARGNTSTTLSGISNGGNSTFNGLTAVGGGYGGGVGPISYGGNNGGSGGGAINAAGANSFGTGTAGQGFNGGNAPFSPPGGAGGGGGAGGAGSAGNGDGAGGAGGIGVQSSITGTATYYAGGGAGGGLIFTPSGLGRNTYGGGMSTDAAEVVILPNPGVLIIRYLRSQVE